MWRRFGFGRSRVVPELRRIAQLLEQQTVLLIAIAGALVQEQEPESDECRHPDDNRVSLATPGRPDHWICNACRYEHQGVIQN